MDQSNEMFITDVSNYFKSRGYKDNNRIIDNLIKMCDNLIQINLADLDKINKPVYRKICEMEPELICKYMYAHIQHFVIKHNINVNNIIIRICGKYGPVLYYSVSGECYGKWEDTLLVLKKLK